MNDLKASDDEILELDVVLTRHLNRVMELSGGRISGPGGAADLLNINPSTLGRYFANWVSRSAARSDRKEDIGP